ncbi:predicted protein [Streptomyces sp. AA4]|nr:predicted protein [Streptomyces sp. AA4]
MQLSRGGKCLDRKCGRWIPAAVFAVPGTVGGGWNILPKVAQGNHFRSGRECGTAFSLGALRGLLALVKQLLRQR